MSIGNQVPPDNNSGVQFPIQLSISSALRIGNSHVLQRNAEDMSASALTVRSDVTNTTARAQTGIVVATITPPAGAGSPIEVRQSVTVPAGATRTVSFEPARYRSLNLEHPRLWWPYQMGGQPLYTLSTSLSDGQTLASSPPERFGIRTIRSSLTGPSSLAPHGVRVYAVNGVPFLFRAGGWSENLFLHYSSRDVARQISLIRSMGLNSIRTEGHEMPDNFYEQMDAAGIMIDAGFQCCDRWQPPRNGAGLTPHDYAIMYLSALTIGEQLRNHPSVVTFSWSDNAPIREQEIVSLKAFAAADFREPIVSSAEYRSSPLLGPSGEKEGPYDWVPPSYWYDTTHGNPGDSTQTNVGGSWGFDSEQSGGDTVPTMDSIRRFMSPRDQTELWTNPLFNQYHTDYEPGHTG
jgi:exo-1,4-beta-D-glucosaminidase